MRIENKQRFDIIDLLLVTIIKAFLLLTLLFAAPACAIETLRQKRNAKRASKQFALARHS